MIPRDPPACSRSFKPLVCRRPRESFRVLRSDRDALGVRVLSITYASVVVSIAAYIFLLSIEIIAREGEPISAGTKDEIFTRAVILCTVSPFVLMVLTELEHLLITYFYRRPSTEMVRVLCDHSCVGWAAGATGTLLGSILLLIIALSEHMLPDPDVDTMYNLSLFLIGCLMLISFVMMFSSLVYGFVAFHIYLLWGLRRLRYANRVRLTSPSQ